MKIDFNNLRKLSVSTYDSLCRKLNDANKGGYVVIEPDDIKDDMDELRQYIMAIAFCSDESDGFADLSKEIDLVAEFNAE